MEYITETRKVPIEWKYEIIIVGGGIAGVSAALAAARQGRKVLLIEKQCILGGLATAGLIAIYLPLCDGSGHQVSFGIAEELLRLSLQESVGRRCLECWLVEGTIEERKKQRFEAQFNPQMLALLLDELLRKNGVDILYDTKICGVKSKEEQIEALLIENKSGRKGIAAEMYVDASGDADIFWYAGAKTEEHLSGNGMASWYFGSTKDSEPKLRILGECDSVLERKKREELSGKRFSGLDGKENSHMLQEAHKYMLEDIRKRREKDCFYEPITLATMPQIRMSRKISGQYVLSEKEKFKDFTDSIGLIADWRKKNAVYEIPYRCLVSPEYKNLLSAGRCISVEEGMWDITRVIPGCAVTGQAAGAAASLMGDCRNTDVKIVQQILEKQGQKLKLSEVLL